MPAAVALGRAPPRVPLEHAHGTLTGEIQPDSSDVFTVDRR